MNSRYLRALFGSFLVALIAATSWSQVEVGPDQHYLLLATTRTSTMQESCRRVPLARAPGRSCSRINSTSFAQAAALGFRIVVGSPTSADEMVILLERVATPPDIYSYELLATSNTSTMQEELDEATSRGFRLLPSTMISKSSMWGSDELVVVLERSPGEVLRYEYRLLATNRTATLQAEVTQARAEGFEIHGLVSRGEHVVIMGREADR